jgi:hypothetical protein
MFINAVYTLFGEAHSLTRSMTLSSKVFVFLSISSCALNSVFIPSRHSSNFNSNFVRLSSALLAAIDAVDLL